MECPKNPIEQYFNDINDVTIRRLAKKVRLIARESLPQAEEKIYRGNPSYLVDGRAVAMIADYSKQINLYFPQGAKLRSPLLEGTGKGMRHIKISSEGDIKPAEFSKLLKQAANNA
jgi:hypothetical protein